MAFRLVRDLIRLRVRAREFLDLNVLELALGALGLQGEIALARVALADAGNFFPVDAQFGVEALSK